jgi:hypothetical protein
MTLSESHVYTVSQIGTMAGSRTCEGDTGPENCAAGLCVHIISDPLYPRMAMRSRI